MDLSVEVVVEAQDIVGEGPMWDERYAVLRWVDIIGKRIHSYDPATGDHNVVDVPEAPGTIAPRAAGGLIVATPRGFFSYDLETGEQELLAEVDAEDTTTRMNDGKCDRQGRMWAGTMEYAAKPKAGAFYRLDTDLSVTKQFGDVTVANGLVWSEDDTRLYWIDSMTYSIDVFDFDPVAGAISNRRTAIKIPESDGIPDGMTMDTEGYLWLALHRGSAVHRYSIEGRLDAVIELPVTQVTSCAFAGPDLTDLYITSARDGMSDEELEAQPLAGALFRCRPGVQGYPVDAFAG